MGDFNGNLEAQKSLEATQKALGAESALVPFEGAWHMRAQAQLDNSAVRQDFAQAYKPMLTATAETDWQITKDANGAHFIHFEGDAQWRRLLPIAQNGANLAGVTYSFRKTDGSLEQKSVIIQQAGNGQMSGVQKVNIQDAQGTRANIVYAFNGSHEGVGVGKTAQNWSQAQSNYMATWPQRQAQLKNLMQMPGNQFQTYAPSTSFESNIPAQSRIPQGYARFLRQAQGNSYARTQSQGSSYAGNQFEGSRQLAPQAQPSTTNSDNILDSL